MRSLKFGPLIVLAYLIILQSVVFCRSKKSPGKLTGDEFFEKAEEFESNGEFDNSADNFWNAIININSER